MSAPLRVPLRQRGRFVLLTLILALLLLGAAVAGAYAWLSARLPRARSGHGELAHRGDPGTSLRTRLEPLQAAGTIRDARAVEWYLRLTGAHVRVETGLYEIPRTGESARDPGAVRRGAGRARAAHGGRGLDLRGLPGRARRSTPHVAHTLRGKSAAQVMSGARASRASCRRVSSFRTPTASPPTRPTRTS